jgi:protein-S-isoprenylcysteine O-methyltransferase Ste14
MTDYTRPTLQHYSLSKSDHKFTMIKFGIFILLSILLLAFTLNRPHPHRFPRFFAFESLLGLVILNARSWFLNPFSLRQIVSWIFLLSSLVLAIHGFRLLRTAGSPKDDIEETTQIVTIGAYRYIRHPLYCSLILGGGGAFLKNFSFLGLILFVTLSSFVYLTGKIEEDENIKRFGEKYRNYMEKTRMFIPFLI